MQIEPVAETGSSLVHGGLQGLATTVKLKQGQINLTLDKLELTVLLILSPSSHPTSGAGAVVEPEIKLVVTAGQTGGVHVALTQVNVLVDSQQGDVVVQSLGAELWVLGDLDHSVLSVLLLLRGVESRGVPFTNSNFQQTKKII